MKKSSKEEQKLDLEVIQDDDKEDMGLAEEDLDDVIQMNLKRLNSNDNKRKDTAAKTIPNLQLSNLMDFENRHDPDELSLSDIKRRKYSASDC